MTEPRADDPAVLVAEARQQAPFVAESSFTASSLLLRLADALEQAQEDARKYRDLYSGALERNSEIYEQNKADLAGLRQMCLALLYVDGPEVREIARMELDDSQVGVEFLAQLDAARAEAAGLRDGLNSLEWSSRERTVAGNALDFCPVCHGSPVHVKLNPHLAPRNGHRRTCKLADLLGYPPSLAQFIPVTQPEEPARE